jgi:hypothetical protein
VSSSEEVIVEGNDNPHVATYVAPEVDAWDRWNYARTDHLIDAVSTRYVGSGIYGVDELDHYGTWRTTSEYGPVWVPSGVGPAWAPYSAGRWIWDPLYGWSWVDDAPWGWAPCHYGRWVQASGFWAWAPGPLVAAPVYVVNVNNINVYQNTRVRNAVVGLREDQFGRARGGFVRAGSLDPRQAEPIRGKLPIQPVAASLTPRSGGAAKPPAALLGRSVVATRPPLDPAPALRAAGLKFVPQMPSPARIVAAPHGSNPSFNSPRAPFWKQGTAERAVPPPPPRFGRATQPQSQSPRAAAPSQPLPHGGKAPAPQLQRSTRQLPGEPANRLYGGAPPAKMAPHASIPQFSHRSAGDAPQPLVREQRMPAPQEGQPRPMSAPPRGAVPSGRGGHSKSMHN